MKIDLKAALHIVDVRTKLRPARFLCNASKTTVWAAFVKCAAGVCTGLPNKIRVGKESSFGDDNYTNADGVVTNISRSGTKVFSSLGIGERLHQP